MSEKISTTVTTTNDVVAQQSSLSSSFVRGSPRLLSDMEDCLMDQLLTSSTCLFWLKF